MLHAKFKALLSSYLSEISCLQLFIFSPAMTYITVVMQCYVSCSAVAEIISGIFRIKIGHVF